ncbi:MAG: DUF4197 domain-containing protein [Micavibrio sp.]
MFRRFASISVIAVLALGACVSSGEQADWMEQARGILNSPLGQAGVSSLSDSQIVAGLKEALTVGTGAVVAQLGQSGGFNLDPQIRIPLPENLARVDTALKTVGMGSLTEELQHRMNMAAEMATPRAKELFISAVSQMTFDDASAILSGQQDAATQYLRKTMGAELVNDMKPIINNTLAQAGAVQTYEQVMGQYAKLPFMPDVKANLTDYAANKAMDGIFHYVAQEEAAIRQNPAKRTTELLQKVFGAAQAGR